VWSTRNAAATVTMVSAVEGRGLWFSSRYPKQV
jgi:hypothetical protein